MSSTLTNRLDKIENEIRVMLMLQKCGGCVQETQSKTSTSPADDTENNANSPSPEAKKAKNQRPLKKPSSRCTVESCKQFREHQKSSRYPIRSSSEEARTPLLTSDFPTQSPLRRACLCNSGIVYKDISPPSQPPSSIEPKTEHRSMCVCGINPLLELEYEQARRLRLQDEVEKLKIKVSNLTQSKSMAITMTKQLKKKYDKVRNSLEESKTKFQAVTREKEFLCKCLEREREFNASRTKAKGDSGIQVTKEDEIKCICKGSGLETIQEQDEKIKTLHESMMHLSKTVEEKEIEKQRIEQEKIDAEKNLIKHKVVTKKLAETNTKLAKTVKTKHESFMALRNKNGKYQKEMDDYKSELRKSQLELDRIKHELQKERSKSQMGIGKSVEDMSAKLKKTKDKERRASETIQLLNQQLRDLEDKGNKAAQKEINHLRNDIKNIQTKLDEATKKLVECQEAEAKKAEALKKEVSAVSQTLQEKQISYNMESEQLKTKSVVLQDTVEQLKKRIEELEEIKMQQDVVINSQNEQLLSKDEQLKLQEEENAIVKVKFLDMDREMRSTVDMSQQPTTPVTNDSEKIKQLEDQINELKSDLKSAQQKLSENEKIIEEQNSKLETLKNATQKSSEEVLIRTTRELTKEQDRSQTAMAGLAKMQLKKDALFRKMDDLESACEKLLTEKARTGRAVMEMKKQLQEEVKLRIETCQRLEDEKDAAINVARLAKRTLVETVDDYQRQIKSQIHIQRSIVDILRAKKQKRRRSFHPPPRHSEPPPIDAMKTEADKSSVRRGHLPETALKENDTQRSEDRFQRYGLPDRVATRRESSSDYPPQEEYRWQQRSAPSGSRYQPGESRYGSSQRYITSDTDSMSEVGATPGGRPYQRREDDCAPCRKYSDAISRLRRPEKKEYDSDDMYYGSRLRFQTDQYYSDTDDRGLGMRGRYSTGLRKLPMPDISPLSMRPVMVPLSTYAHGGWTDRADQNVQVSHKCRCANPGCPCDYGVPCQTNETRPPRDRSKSPGKKKPCVCPNKKKIAR